MCHLHSHRHSHPLHICNVYGSGAVGEAFGVYSNWDPTIFPLNRFRISSYRTLSEM